MTSNPAWPWKWMSISPWIMALLYEPNGGIALFRRRAILPVGDEGGKDHGRGHGPGRVRGRGALLVLAPDPVARHERRTAQASAQGSARRHPQEDARALALRRLEIAPAHPRGPGPERRGRQGEGRRPEDSRRHVLHLLAERDEQVPQVHGAELPRAARRRARTEGAEHHAGRA